MMMDREIEQVVLEEADGAPDSQTDPYWCPMTSTVDELACILARSFIMRTDLLNMGACCGTIEDVNADIAKRLRWLRNRGEGFPGEVPSINLLKARYCRAAAILAEEPGYFYDDIDDGSRGIADLAMGACHMIAREFYGSSDVLFADG